MLERLIEIAGILAVWAVVALLYRLVGAIEHLLFLERELPLRRGLEPAPRVRQALDRLVRTHSGRGSDDQSKN